jgi:hypothetical protein
VKRRWIIAILAVCAVAGILAAAFPPREREREPEYGGKKLSEWLMIAAQSNTSLEDPSEASDALRHLGTNAIPSLLRWIQYEKSRRKYELFERYEKWPKPLVNSYVERWLLDCKRRERVVEAHLAFDFLGPDAAPAVPELARLMQNVSPGSSSLRAAVALARIGRAGFPPLEAAITNRAGSVALRTCAVFGMQFVGSDVDWASPAHRGALEAPDYLVRQPATNALQWIGPEILERGAQTNGNSRHEN